MPSTEGTDEPNVQYCSIPGCNEYIKNHYWGRVKAAGWFFAKNGMLFCPKHLPAFVKEARSNIKPQEK